ncbi:unnamed protein product [Cylicocyclus nassatus]|uniref:Uncharacterized protein n=1 Tax=Cylicocyclus nassatus TaxID=53992 RepID=A0AA36GX56_CYLNA|nr:unnamed protein product [Cylicocyclus nassatus]
MCAFKSTILYPQIIGFLLAKYINKLFKPKVLSAKAYSMPNIASSCYGQNSSLYELNEVLREGFNEVLKEMCSKTRLEYNCYLAQTVEFLSPRNDHGFLVFEYSIYGNPLANFLGMIGDDLYEHFKQSWWRKLLGLENKKHYLFGCASSMKDQLWKIKCAFQRRDSSVLQ